MVPLKQTRKEELRQCIAWIDTTTIRLARQNPTWKFAREKRSAEIMKRILHDLHIVMADLHLLLALE